MVLFSQVSAVELTQNDKKVAVKIAKSIENIVNNKTPLYKEIWKGRLEQILLKLDSDSKKYALFSEILENHLKMWFTPYINSHLSKFNINKTLVNNYWVDLHNNARNSNWLNNYSYDTRLENTAIEWSYNNYNKWKMDHKRDSNDSWYDYNKIENWFQERGVTCSVKWWTTSSESIAKYWYYCTDWECSNELNTSLKVIFDIYMNEKTLSYPANTHYKAIVSPNITKMWFWISVYKSDLPDYYEYYIATHYCTEFQ